MRTRSARAAAAAAGGDDAGTDGVPDKVRSANAFAEGDNASENEDISDDEKSGNKGAEEDSGGEEEEASSGSEEEAADEEDDAADVSGTNDQKWQGFYDQLKKQYGEVGHCRVKQKFEMKQGKKKQVYQPLAAFVKRQRALHSAGKLKSHRVELLKAINFAFDHKKETWMEKLDQLKLYKMHKSHCKVTNKDGKDYDGLPNFVRIQRAEWRKMRNGKKSAMTQDRLELLEEIGFDFNPSNIAITDEEKVSTSSSFGDCSYCSQPMAMLFCINEYVGTLILPLPHMHALSSSPSRKLPRLKRAHTPRKLPQKQRREIRNQRTRPLRRRSLRPTREQVPYLQQVSMLAVRSRRLQRRPRKR